MMETYPEDKEVNFKGFHYKIWDSLSSKIKFQIIVTNKIHQTQTEPWVYICSNEWENAYPDGVNLSDNI